MRTSRTARETARVRNGSASPLPTRRSLRAFAYNAHAPPAETDIGRSDLPPSPGSPRSSSLGKRKRPGPATKPPSITITAPEVRRSPRKAITAEDAPPRKPARQPAKRIQGDPGTVPVTPPANWEEVYNVTSEMRKRVPAPVDTMGCESLAEEHRSPRDRRLQTLVALMLSSQTKDAVTAAAMRNLQAGLPGGFNLEALLDVRPERLNGLIAKVGFHNNKTKFIRQMAVILRERFQGDIPDSIEGLVSLPGVGPKMAYLTMSAAWGRDEGIGVDVHVHRITNLWGWHKTSTPEQTRAELEAWLPREKWHDINHLLVGLGQTICAPVGRKCGDCDLSTRKLCPSAVAGSPRKRVKREVKVKTEEGEVREERAVAEADDVAATVQIKSEELGDARITVLDIEGLGAGIVRKLADIAGAGS